MVYLIPYKWTLLCMMICQIDSFLFTLDNHRFLYHLYHSDRSSSIRFVNTNQNRITKRFDEMVDRFRTYTDADIDFLDNARMQDLLRGGLDALNEPKVLTAFSVLYEDILPVRFGGDILFNLLDKSILQARAVNARRTRAGKVQPIKADLETQVVATFSSSNVPVVVKRNDEHHKVANISRLKMKVINQISKITERNPNECHTSYLFSAMDTDDDGGVSKEEFMRWVESVLITDKEENDGLDIDWNEYSAGLYSEIDGDSDGTLSFGELKLWTTGLLKNKVHHVTDESNQPTDMFSVTTPLSVEIDKVGTAKKQLNVIQKRYLYMVEKFILWEGKWNSDSRASTRPSRTDLVIMGCFAGAKRQGVVDALEILYEDYIPLRIAGDMIFKLVETAMK